MRHIANTAYTPNEFAVNRLYRRYCNYHDVNDDILRYELAQLKKTAQGAGALEWYVIKKVNEKLTENAIIRFNILLMNDASFIG